MNPVLLNRFNDGFLDDFDDVVESVNEVSESRFLDG